MLQAGALLAYGPVWCLVGVLHLCGRSHGGDTPDFLTSAFAPAHFDQCLRTSHILRRGLAHHQHARVDWQSRDHPVAPNQGRRPLARDIGLKGPIIP